MLGFWKALPQVFGTTRKQRCWAHKTVNILDHKTVNILDKLSKSQQPKAKTALQAVWMAATRTDRRRTGL
ncbi:MAG: hypothetical protein IPK63_04430 [Candidatus Competibacteraceae bacterium]|nr:hypothetical protein [Candidatus Competibacteraceae bacterium]